MFRKTQHLGVRNVSMDYAVRYPVSTEFILLTLKAALEKLNNLHEYRRQFTPRHKSPSAKTRTQQWLDLLGVDQQALRRVRFIHVAGTKGKGTTCLYCESILTEYQKTTGDRFKIGCLTSPHVTNIRERIRLDASSISEQLFARYFFEMWGRMESYYRLGSNGGPSLPGYPGFLTLLAMYIIVKEEVNVAIVETGIGGENDSTNVIPSPTVVGITTIGLDHVNVLGSELRSIAWHKAGIFKQDSPAYTVQQNCVALKVLKERAGEKRISGALGIVPESLVADYAVTVNPDLAFQRQNASLAIVLADSFLKVMRPNFEMTRELVRSIEKTELPGRSQIMRAGRLMWYISSAHNEISIEVAARWYRDAVKHSDPEIPRVLVFGHASRRDTDTISNRLFETLQQDRLDFDSVLFCSAATGLEEKHQDFFDPRNLHKPSLKSLQQLAVKWERLKAGMTVTVENSVKDAMNAVQNKYDHQGAQILVVGSVYQAGAVIVMLKAGEQGNRILGEGGDENRALGLE